jgi:hypothetical protein
MSHVNDELLPTRKLRLRYSTSDRNLLRWERAGVLPAPIWINGRKYWRLSDLEYAERAGMGARKANREGA